MANIKPIRYVRNAGNTVGFSELQSGETIAWGDVDHPVFANVATTGSYTDLSNAPTNVSAFTNDAGYALASAIPDSILDLGISDGTTGQVLIANGNGTFTFSNAGAAAAGGSSTQFQYNSNGTITGSSALTTDGANLSIYNTTITSDNRFDRTDLNWVTGSTGSLGTIKFGNESTNNYDIFNNRRNSKVRVEQTLNKTGAHTASIRRTAITGAHNFINSTGGNITISNSSDRNAGVIGESTVHGGGFTVTGFDRNAVGIASIATLDTGTFTVGGTSSFSTIAANAAVVAKGIGVNSLITGQNNSTITRSFNYVASFSNGTGTNSYGDTYAYYMGPPVGTADTIGTTSGSPAAATQTGVPYFLYCNNSRAESKIGSIRTADEVYTVTNGPVATDVLSLNLSNSMVYQINLQPTANISSLSFTGLPSGTTRLTNCTLIFKQSSVGNSYVYWPAGTKFAGGIDQISLTADSVTFVSVLIHDGVYYVTIGAYV